MAGVVPFDKRGKPIYKTKPLGNVDKKGDRICALFYCLNFVSLFSAIFLFSNIPYKEIHYTNYSYERYREEVQSTLIVWVLVFSAVESVFFLLLGLSARYTCCITQYVKCGISQKANRKLAQATKIFGSIMTTCSLLADVEAPFKIAATCYCAGINLCILGCLAYARKCCQCKECLGLKDVKIRYGETTISVAETNPINSFYLQHALNIPYMKDTRIALQIKDGEIVHVYLGTEFIQLHEGEYIVREFTHFLNPMDGGAQQKTTVYSNELIGKFDWDDSKFTVMNIDE